MNKVNNRAALVSPDAIALSGSVLLAQVVESLCMKGKISKFESPFHGVIDMWNDSQIGYKHPNKGQSYFAEGIRVGDVEGIIHIHTFLRNQITQTEISINGEISFELLMTIIEGLL